MTHKTIKEQEREAYITGHVYMADLLAKLDESDESEAEHEEHIGELNDVILSLEGMVSELDAETDELKQKLADYE